MTNSEELVAQLGQRLVCAVEDDEPVPTLDQLAAEAGLPPHQLHRAFVRQLGLSPSRFVAALRAARVRRHLATGCPVTEAIFEAGYSSTSRFYERADTVLGMLPKRYRAGGRDETIDFALGPCSLGEVLVARSSRGVCALFLGDEPGMLIEALEDRFPRAKLVAHDPDWDRLVARAVALVDQSSADLGLPLDLRGTAFQQRVWQALTEIPRGETRSYAELAAAIGRPQATRAVASACGANPVAVAIPCHRVVRRDGSLGGYRWGLKCKTGLLEGERRLQ